MAFKRPPPPGFEEEWRRLARRSAELRREFAAFLDDCDRLLRRARFASLTHKEAVAAMLSRLQSDGRVLQVRHGRWTARPSSRNRREASANGESDDRRRGRC